MGDFSKINDLLRLPVNIAVLPYMRDHVFQGNPVFPAVESMQLLAVTVQKSFPDLDVMNLTAVAFDKFLVLPPREEILEAGVDIEKIPDGGVRTKLITRMRLGTSGMTRIKEHARVCFFPRQKSSEVSDVPVAQKITPEMAVPPDRVYRELVPFGPAYQNLSGRVGLSHAAAIAEISAPKLPSTGGPLGSSFVLDAAFHVACVWGQRYSGFIGFPVGFDSRIVMKATKTGGKYRAHLCPVSTGSNENVYNLWIYGPDNGIFEIVKGLRMRDVSGGRMKPPGWIRKD